MVELSVVILLLGLVTAIFFSALASTQAAVRSSTKRADANANVRLALAEIDRQVRSGNIIQDPAAENDPANGLRPGLALRLYTQADLASATSTCVQWRILGTDLQRRSWTPDWASSGTVTPWRTIVPNIQNGVSPTVTAFALAPEASYGGRLINVTLLVSSGDKSSKPARAEISVEARNSPFRYPSTICSSTPPSS